MLCEICRKNKANVHITKIIGGIKHELNICESCTQNIVKIDPIIHVKHLSPFTLKNLLGGLMDNIVDPINDYNESKCMCENCKTTYAEIKNTGLVGCSQCYKNLNSMMVPIIKRIQGNIGHSGKIPKRTGGEIIERKKIAELKDNLKEAVKLEKYEDAARIRDMIKKIESKEGDE